MSRPLARRRLLAAGGGLLAAGCGQTAGQRAMLSQAPLVVQPAPAPSPAALPAVRLPQDDAPHNALTEWWYYTGHLYPDAGPAPAEYGFELVFFRGIRGDRPPGYAAHFAITDPARAQFRFDQRQDVALNEAAAPQPGPAGDPPARPAPRPPGIVSLSPPGGGFDLLLGDWWMRGREGRDHLAAAMPGFKLTADLVALRPPALHLGAAPLQPGLLSFGPAGYSYYYSRTRLALTGTLEVDGALLPVHGEAWFDHQWGDFLVLGGGGWDWFAGTLRDGRDLTVSVIRDAAGAPLIAYGTLVRADGSALHLPPGSFEVTATDRWVSPRTAVRYPSGWRLQVTPEDLDLTWTPLLPDQEFDARASSGVVYWEGAVRLTATATGEDAGRGYVELTGYTAAR